MLKLEPSDLIDFINTLDIKHSIRQINFTKLGVMRPFLDIETRVIYVAIAPIRPINSETVQGMFSRAKTLTE